MKKWGRAAVLLISIALILWFVRQHGQDLSALPAYLRRLRTGHAAGLLAVEALFLLMLALSNVLLYRMQGVMSRLHEQFLLLAASGAIERVLPSAGVAGMSSFVWLARQRGIPVAESVKMTGTSFVIGYLQIAPMVVLPLFTATTLVTGEQAAWFLGVFLGVVGMLVLLVFVTGHARASSLAVRMFRLRRYPRLLAFWEGARAHLGWMWRHRTQLLPILALLWMIYPVRVAMVWGCFQSLGVDVSWSMAWGAYSVTLLIGFLSFLPTTLGVFELTMVGAMTALGVPGDAAVAGTMLYRVFSWWLPIPVGLAAYAWIRRKGKVE